MKTINKSWVLITGASSGFGEEFARQYAEQRPLGGPGGAPAGPASSTRRCTTPTVPHRHRGVEQVDLSDVAAVIQLHRRLREQGIAIDILINNAGHGDGKSSRTTASANDTLPVAWLSRRFPTHHPWRPPCISTARRDAASVLMY